MCMRGDSEMTPVVYDLYCGLGGWTEGFLAEGYRCIGFDIEAHDYGTGGYPGESRIRDVFALSSHIARCFKPASVSTDEKVS